MAHSKVQNAGQRYASARKRGEQGKTLDALRAAVGNRRGANPDAEEAARVNAQVVKANRDKAYW